MTVSQPANAYFETAVEYCSYYLANRSQHYDEHLTRHIVKMTKRLEVQLKSEISDRSDWITILSFLQEFQMACDMNGIHEGSAVLLFQFL